MTTTTDSLAIMLRRAAMLEREGKSTDALALVRNASLHCPGDTAMHRAIAQTAMRLGDPELAIDQMRRACDLAPHDPVMRFQFACLLAHQGLHAAAIPHFMDAAGQRPDDAAIHHLLGLSLQRLGRNGDALPALRRAHALSPGNDHILEALAESEFHAGHPDDALPFWEQILRLRPYDTGVIQRTTETLNRLGRSSEAMHILQQAAEQQPDATELWMAMAQTAEDLGDRDAARAAYESALALRPDWAFPVSGLLALDRGKAKDALVAQAERLLARTDSSDADRALLGYELGKALDGRGRYNEAMASWHVANSARRRMTGAADPRAFMRQAERLMDDTSRRWPLPAGSWPGSDSPCPVFVVGMPRSGTTLTEQILAAHPLAHGCGELPDMTLIARSFARGEPQSSWPEPSFDHPHAFWESAAQRYMRAATRNAPPGALRLVDKAPLNFFHLEMIARLFPKAHVIWCRRDPRDIAVSIYSENFSLEEKLSTDLEDIGHYINLQTRLMRHWQARLPLPILELHYETLVSDPGSSARQLVEFVGLPWDPACLDFHRSERGVQTPSRWQVKQPIHARSTGRWKNYAQALAPLLQVLDADAYPSSGAATRDQPSTPSA
jgi:Flp pilus assembly protein TadD